MIRRIYFFCCFFFFSQTCFSKLVSLSKNNPFPLFGTLIFDYVSLKERSNFAPDLYTEKLGNNVSIGISFANQTANEGKRINGRSFTPSTTNPQDFTEDYVPLGDLNGRTNLIAVLGGALPKNQTLPTILQQAKDNLQINATNFNETLIDPLSQFGCNTTELKYSKKSALITIKAILGSGFGLSLDTEIASIKQNVNQIINQTVADSALMSLNASDVNNQLMNQFTTIVTACSQQITRLSKTTIGEVRFGLFWRNYFEVNNDTTLWPHLLFMPFIETQISLSPDKTPALTIFKAPFGNNGHMSAGLSGGLLFDFVDSVYLAAEAGYTYFFKRNIDQMPVPNNSYQINLYPFSTNVSVKPGGSWYFSGKIGSRHFVDRLSASIEYVITEHSKDSINIINNDPAFVPSVLENFSIFKFKLLNLCFTYDVAPSLNFGFTWQTPIQIRNGYRSSTLIFSINGLF